MDTWLAFVQLHCGSSSDVHLGCFSFGHYRQCWNILTCSSSYLCLVLKTALSSGNPHFLLKPQVKCVCLWVRSSNLGNRVEKAGGQPCCQKAVGPCCSPEGLSPKDQFPVSLSSWCCTHWDRVPLLHLLPNLPKWTPTSRKWTWEGLVQCFSNCWTVASQWVTESN